MKDLFVPYELAKQLKDKGFDKECMAYFNKQGKLVYSKSLPVQMNDNQCAAPLYQQAEQWISEVHGIDIDKINVSSMPTVTSYYEIKAKAIEEALNLI